MNLKKETRGKKRSVSRSAIRKRSDRGSSSPKLTKKIELSTFDSWLGHQKEHTHEKGTFRSFTEGKMLANTTEVWLAKQSVSEHPQKEDLAAPVSTMEEWLRKQVSERLAAEEKNGELLTQQQS